MKFEEWLEKREASGVIDIRSPYLDRPESSPEDDDYSPPEDDVFDYEIDEPSASDLMYKIGSQFGRTLRNQPDMPYGMHDAGQSTKVKRSNEESRLERYANLQMKEKSGDLTPAERILLNMMRLRYQSDLGEIKPPTKETEKWLSKFNV